MQIFTIKIDSREDAQKLKKVLSSMPSAKVSLIEDDNQKIKKSKALDELRSRILKSRQSVAQGKYIPNDEFESISDKLLKKKD